MLLTAALASTALVVAAPAIAAAYNDESLVWPLRGMAISLIAETVFALYLSTFVALARVAVNLRLVFIESAAEMAATLALVVAGTGRGRSSIRSRGRLRGWSGDRGCDRAAYSGSCLRRGLVATERQWIHRQIRRYAVPLFVLDGLYGLYTRVDVLFVGALAQHDGRRRVRRTEATPSRLWRASGWRWQTASHRARRHQTEDPRVDAFTAAIRWLVILHAAFIAPLIVWADPIVDVLFGSEYAESAEVLRWLAPYVLLSGVSPVISNTVNFLGHAGRRIPIALGALAVNVAINIALLPRIGVAAAAIGASAALWAYVPAHLRICRLELGFPLRPMLLSSSASPRRCRGDGRRPPARRRHPDTVSRNGVARDVLGLVVYTGTLALTREISRHAPAPLARTVESLLLKH